MKLRLASLDVRIAHVHGVGVAVHNQGRFVRVTADVKHDFHYVGHDWKQESPADAVKPARRKSMPKLLQFDVFRFISPNSIPQIANL